MKRVVFLMGPTGSGKTQASYGLAAQGSVSIYNCDSVQLYQKVDIGSAKPSGTDLSRCKHLLFDVISPPNEVTAGDYRRMAMQALSESNEELAVFVGGAGFYFLALEKGMLDAPKADPELRKEIELRLEVSGAEVLHSELAKLDPISANRIHVNDHYRLVRALEVILSTSKSLSQVWQDKEVATEKFPYPLLKLAIYVDRAELRQKLIVRTEKMLADGLVLEVEQLLKEGLVDWWPMKSIGYQETVAFLQGGIASIDELREKIVQNSLGLAKKQMTWLKRFDDVIWIDRIRLEQLELRDVYNMFPKTLT